MANARIIITKSISFRGQLEEFSNGYTFQADSSGWTTTQWVNLIEFVKAVERTLHATNVNFLRGTGGPQGQPAAHVTDFTGQAGVYAPAGNIIPHPEVCVMAQAQVARGRVLTKYYHVGKLAAAAGDTPGAEVARCNAILADLTNGTAPTGVKACAPNGDIPPVPFTVDAFLRTHQFHQGKKRPQ